MKLPKYATFEEWNELGFYVRKGEKHVKRNGDNECLFHIDQVKESSCPLCGAPLDEYCGCYGDLHWGSD